MCDIKDGFKLCTCDEKLAAQDIDWVLKRTNPELPLVHRKGRAIMPRYNAKEQDIQSLILKNLNTQNCFDFDYTPQPNDYVRIRAKVANKTEYQWFAYRFQRDQWQIDQTDSLAAWKTQLEPLKNGVVE